MSAQHTPGPWRVDNDGTVSAQRPHGIAFIAEVDGGENHNAADGSLIAAAPELLAALRAIIEPNNKRAVRFDSSRQYYVADIEAGELERARAAIAKAGGRS